jgi:hypothetical protein
MKKFTPIRWTIEHASSEFNLDRKTVTKRVKAAGLEPGNDGRFSTAQIASALHGDLEAEKIRLTREQADDFAISNEKQRRIVVEIDDLLNALERRFIAHKQIVENLPITPDQKQVILNGLADILSSIPRPEDAGDAKSSGPARRNHKT